MFPSQQFTGQEPSSPGAPRVPPAPPQNNLVIQPTSSTSTPYENLPTTPGPPRMGLPTKQFQPAAEPRRTDVAGIAELPPLPEITYDEFDADYESSDSSDLGCAEGKALINLKQMEFSFKQFAKRIWQPNFSVFNKWKKVWVAGFLEKKHRSIIPGRSHFEKLRDRHLHWETAVPDIVDGFETWLPLKNVGTAKRIWQQWVEIFSKKCASEVWEPRKKGRRGHMRPVTDLAERGGNKAGGNVPELPNTTFMVVICRVPNVNNDKTSSNQLQALNKDVRHWEELIDFIEQNCCLKEQYCLTAIYKCNLMQEEEEEEYMG